MTSDAIIDDLGGNSAVAAALGVDDTTVSTWRRRGIPPARWAALVDLAARSSKPLTFETLASLRAA